MTWKLTVQGQEKCEKQHQLLTKRCQSSPAWLFTKTYIHQALCLQIKVETNSRTHIIVFWDKLFDLFDFFYSEQKSTFTAATHFKFNYDEFKSNELFVDS